MSNLTLTEEEADGLNPFQVLGVNKYLIDRVSNDDELKKLVKSLYIHQIKQIHPDAHSGCKTKESSLKMLNRAWDKIEKAQNLSVFRSNQNENISFGSSFAKQLNAQDDAKEIGRLKNEIQHLKKSDARKREDEDGEDSKKLKLLEERIVSNHVSLVKNRKSRTSFSPHSLVNRVRVETEAQHIAMSTTITPMKSVITVDRNLFATREDFFLNEKTGRRSPHNIPASGNKDNGDTYLVGSIHPKHLKGLGCLLSKNEMFSLFPFLESKIEKGVCLIYILNRNQPAYYVSGKVIGFIKIKKTTKSRKRG